MWISTNLQCAWLCEWCWIASATALWWRLQHRQGALAQSANWELWGDPSWWTPVTQHGTWTPHREPHWNMMLKMIQGKQKNLEITQKTWKLHSTCIKKVHYIEMCSLSVTLMTWGSSWEVSSFVRGWWIALLITVLHLCMFFLEIQIVSMARTQILEFLCKPLKRPRSANTHPQGPHDV